MNARSGNRTRVTLVGGERSHHCAIPAPRMLAHGRVTPSIKFASPILDQITAVTSLPLDSTRSPDSTQLAMYIEPKIEKSIENLSRVQL